jgi:hypothetical protein
MSARRERFMQTFAGPDQHEPSLQRRLQHVTDLCALALADARRLDAAGGTRMRPGPLLTRATDLLDEMEELLTLAGSCAPSDARERMVWLRHELQDLALRAAAGDHSR